MKQPIAGIAGLKPRALKPEGDGRLSKQESRALDREYGVQRNETLRLKNFREAMLLAKARGELIERRLVEFQAAHLLIAMRQRALAVPQASPAGCWAWPMRTKRARSFAAMIELLDELKDLPARGDRRELD
jgi:hypothetical protein